MPAIDMMADGADRSAERLVKTITQGLEPSVPMLRLHSPSVGLGCWLLTTNASLFVENRSQHRSRYDAFTFRQLVRTEQ